MEKERGMNVGLLCEVATAIQARPERFDVNEWHSGRGRDVGKQECEGEACIAGWAVMLHERASIGAVEGDEIRRRAREYLRLNDAEANGLFLFGLWPDEVQASYCRMPETPADYENNARLAVQRIAMFIKTNGER